MALSLFGNDPSAYYTGQQYQQDFGSVTNPTYQNLNLGSMGSNYQNAVNQQLSGQLSPAVLQQLNNQFLGNLQTTQQGAYGMPVGAATNATNQLAGNTALQATLLGQQQIQAGESAATPYMSLMSQNNQYQNQFNQQNTQNQIGQNEYMGNLTQNAYQQSANSGGIFGSLLGAGINYGLGQLQGYGNQQNQSQVPTSLGFGLNSINQNSNFQTPQLGQSYFNNPQFNYQLQ